MMQALFESLNLEEKYCNTVTMLINDFSSINNESLRQLATAVIELSLRDAAIGRQGAKLCWEIITVETESSSVSEDKIFRKYLLNTLQSEFKLMESKEKKKKLAYITFLCSMFDLYKINKKPLTALVKPVFHCLNHLANFKFAKHDDAVQCLVTQLQFIGEQLDTCDRTQMDHLFNLLRELFLSEDSSQLSRLMLLEIIELRGGGWKLSPCAHNYYYGNN